MGWSEALQALGTGLTQLPRQLEQIEQLKLQKQLAPLQLAQAQQQLAAAKQQQELAARGAQLGEAKIATEGVGFDRPIAADSETWQSIQGTPYTAPFEATGGAMPGQSMQFDASGNIVPGDPAVANALGIGTLTQGPAQMLKRPSFNEAQLIKQAENARRVQEALDKSLRGWDANDIRRQGVENSFTLGSGRLANDTARTEAYVQNLRAVQANMVATQQRLAAAQASGNAKDAMDAQIKLAELQMAGERIKQQYASAGKEPYGKDAIDIGTAAAEGGANIKAIIDGLNRAYEAGRGPAAGGPPPGAGAPPSPQGPPNINIQGNLSPLITRALQNYGLEASPAGLAALRGKIGNPGEVGDDVFARYGTSREAILAEINKQLIPQMNIKLR